MTTIGKGVLQVGFDPKQVEQAGKDELVPSAKRVASDIAGVFAAVKIGGFIKGGLDELKDASAVAAQTGAELKSTGGIANVTAGEISDLAGNLSDLSGTDDELIQKGENLLLTFKGVRNEVGEGNDIFNQATKAALDLSTAGFGSVESASVLLGKALNDPVKGLTALQRVGVTLTESQKATVKQLVETGDTLGAQKIILQEVESQVGGSAKAFGESLPGQLAIANESLKNTKAELVAGMAPALELGAGFVKGLTDRFSELPEGAQQAIGGLVLVGGGIASLARPVNDVINLVRTLKPAQEAAAVAATAEAAAQEADAVATTENAGAHGLLSGSLGKAGLVGALAVAGIALYSYGQSLNKTTLDSQELDRITKLTGDDLFAGFDKLEQLARGGGAFSGMLDSTIQGLVEKGPAGIGVLRQYRDHLAGLGEDTSKFDEALAHSSESQANLNANVEAGTDDADKATVATKSYADQLKETADRIQALSDTQHAAVDPLFAAVRATEENRKAMFEAAGAAATYGADSQQAIDANLKVAETALGVQDAALKLAAGVQNGDISVDKFRGTMAQWVQQGLLTQDQADSVAKQFDIVNYSSQALQGRNVQIQTNVTGDALDKLHEIGETVQRLADGTYTVEVDTTNRRPGPRAIGGHVGPNEIFRRDPGEAPELLFGSGLYKAPPAGGYIAPAGETRDWLAGVSAQGGRGGGVVQHFAAGAIVLQGADVREAVTELPDGLRTAAYLAGVG